MDIQVEGAVIKCSFSRMLVLDTWLSIMESSTENEHRNREVYSLTELLPDAERLNIGSLKIKITKLCKRLVTYWKQVDRSRLRMVTKYNDWLGEIEVCELSAIVSEHTLKPAESNQPFSSVLHRKEFMDCSKRTKRRRLDKLVDVDDSAMNYLLSDSSRSNTSRVKFSTNEILSVIIEVKLTKHQYLVLKEFINSQLPNALPSYHKVLEAKKQCYPPEKHIMESSAEIELQSLLDHTTSRIENQNDVLSNADISKEFVLIGKWGFDSEYKQAFSDSSIQDNTVFVTSYCPLRLICKSNTSDPDQIIWKNPRPSSTRFCRPIRFQFAKETKDLSVQEEAYFKNEISNLQPSIFNINNNEIKVVHSLQLTMVDGKVCSALSNTACSRCC